MTVAEFSALEVPWTAVREWRLEELLRAGYDEDDATEVAFHLDVDLHEAITLVRCGCPSRTAVEIML
jgi:hypothetical protein